MKEQLTLVVRHPQNPEQLYKNIWNQTHTEILEIETNSAIASIVNQHVQNFDEPIYFHQTSYNGIPSRIIGRAKVLRIDETGAHPRIQFTAFECLNLNPRGTPAGRGWYLAHYPTIRTFQGVLRATLACPKRLCV